ncbi:MAG: flavin reductase family protein [Thermomicrobiales bacterium]
MTDPAFARAFRRRWPTGVAIATTTAPDGAFRGATVGSLMLLSLEPPTLAMGLATESSFHQLLAEGSPFAVAILDRGGEFLADRFAGRAPVPDARFGGIPHTLAEVDGTAIPVLTGPAVLARAGCTVTGRTMTGDHALIVADIVAGGVGDDTDDPLLFYEGHYRGLEVQR